MNRERIPGLSYFEAVLHGRHRKVTLTSEITECFEYFDEHSPKVLGDYPTVLIHGNGITLRKTAEGKGYSVEVNGEIKIVGVTSIPKEEQVEIVKKIRHITFPYGEHIKRKG